MNKTTQDQTILNHLQSGRSITPAEAARLYNYYRLSANIERLRKAGYDIVTHYEKNSQTTGRHARYELISEVKS